PTASPTPSDHWTESSPATDGTVERALNCEACPSKRRLPVPRPLTPYVHGAVGSDGSEPTRRLRRRRPGAASGQMSGSDVDTRAIQLGGTGDDELLARRDIVTHEQLEHLLGGFGVGGVDAAQPPVARVHGGLGQLLGIHLAEPLVALGSVLHLHPFPRQLPQRAVA